MNDKKNKHGGTLVMVMLVLLSLSILSLGMFKLAERAAVEAIHELHTAQAFWVAESGLQQVAVRLSADSFFYDSIGGRDAPQTGTLKDIVIDADGSVGACKWAVWNLNGVFSIVVEGTVGGQQVSLETKAEVEPAIDAAFVAGMGDSDLGAESEVDGSMVGLKDGQKFLFYSPITINGTVYNTGGVEWKGKKSDVDYVNETTSIEIPTPTGFDEEIKTASDSGVSGSSFGSSITLAAGVTNYVNGDVTATSISGFGGTIVMSGNYEPSGDYAIGDGVTIITGGNGVLASGVSGNIGHGVYIWNNGNAELGQITMSDSGVGSTIEAGGDLKVYGSVDFIGLLHAAGGNFDFQEDDSYLDITGAIVSGDSIKMKETSRLVIDFDHKVLPAWMVTALIDAGGMDVKTYGWNQL